MKKLLPLSILLLLILFFWLKSSPKKVIVLPPRLSDFINKVPGEETIESINQKIGAKVLQDLKSSLNVAGFDCFPTELLIAAFKKERRLEVYGKSESKWNRIKNYPFTRYSGQIGPKLKSGDMQIPEGIYQLEYLNPNSSYHLSIKINYPNEFDKTKALLDRRTQLGGDIFIHGDSITIGCIPIGNRAIEELFVLTAKIAVNTDVKIIIAPKDFRSDSTFPEVTSIDWEDELYSTIQSELNLLIPE